MYICFAELFIFICFLFNMYLLRGEEYIKRIVENMDYLNRGKEFKYIDVREGRESIDDFNKTNRRYTHHKQTHRQTDKQTNRQTFYIYIL